MIPESGERDETQLLEIQTDFFSAKPRFSTLRVSVTLQSLPTVDCELSFVYSYVTRITRSLSLRRRTTIWHACTLIVEVVTLLRARHHG